MSLVDFVHRVAGFGRSDDRQLLLSVRQAVGAQVVLKTGVFVRGGGRSGVVAISSIVGLAKTKHPSPLLIVDDREDLRVSLGRLFGLMFKEVLLASTPAEAEEHMRASSPPFLLCDYWLGPEHPPGSVLVRRLRRLYPVLERVALMTGSKLSALTDTEGADIVFGKPLDTELVRAFFLGPKKLSLV